MWRDDVMCAVFILALKENSVKKMWFVLSVANGRRQEYFLTSCEFHCCMPVSENFISLGLSFLLVP